MCDQYKKAVKLWKRESFRRHVGEKYIVHESKEIDKTIRQLEEKKQRLLKGELFLDKDDGKNIESLKKKLGWSAKEMGIVLKTYSDKRKQRSSSVLYKIFDTLFS